MGCVKRDRSPMHRCALVIDIGWLITIIRADLRFVHMWTSSFRHCATGLTVKNVGIGEVLHGLCDSSAPRISGIPGNPTFMNSYGALLRVGYWLLQAQDCLQKAASQRSAARADYGKVLR